MDPKLFEVLKNGEFQKLDPETQKKILAEKPPEPLLKTKHWIGICLFLLFIIFIPVLINIKTRNNDEIFFWITMNLCLSGAIIACLKDYSHQSMDYIIRESPGRYYGGSMAGIFPEQSGKFKRATGEEAKDRALWIVLGILIWYFIVLIDFNGAEFHYLWF